MNNRKLTDLSRTIPSTKAKRKYTKLAANTLLSESPRRGLVRGKEGEEGEEGGGGGGEGGGEGGRRRWRGMWGRGRGRRGEKVGKDEEKQN